MADEQDGPAGASDLAHSSQAFLLKPLIAHGEDLIDQQDLRLEVGRDREGQAHVHAARIALHRRIEEFLDLREGDDLVEACVSISRRLIPRMLPFK